MMQLDKISSEGSLLSSEELTLKKAREAKSMKSSYKEGGFYTLQPQQLA